MKVRSHLALIVIAVLAPLVLFSALVLHFLLASEREATLRAMQELARGTVLLMDKEMSVAMATAQSLSASGSLYEGDFADFYQQAKFANTARDTNMALIAASGQQVFNTAVPFDKPIAPPTDTTVRRVAQVFAANKPGYTNLLQGRATGKYVVAAEFPVQIRDGRRFLVNEWLFSSALNKLIPTNNVPASWVISVFDREGTTIARNLQADEYVGKPPLDKQRNAVLSRFEGISRGHIRGGIEVYGAWHRSAVSGWTVAVGVPVAEVEHAAVRSVALTALGFLLAILFAVAGAVLFGRRLTSSIEEVSAAARLLGQRKAPAAVDLPIDEMNQLQSALHQAGSLLVASEAARVRHLDEAEKARAAAEQAQAVAEAQNRAKDEFLAMLGHELRNPLAAISSGVAVLNLPGTDAERARRITAIIERQSRHLGHLVDELLDAHRILSGKITLSKSQVDLRTAVQNCIAAFEARDAFRAHSLQVRLAGAVIEADATRLEQMIGNLVENALKYTPEGGSITVSTVVEGGEAVLSVADTGVGIPAELLPRVFEVFVQGKVINRSKGGLGIGLAVVDSLARQHGATLGVASEGVNCGSVFTIRFPLRVRADEDGAAPAPARSAGVQAGAPILVIEDNRDVREMTCLMLAARGFDVISAENGRAGIDSAFMNRPRAALVDIDLPDMSGHDIAAALRSDPRTAAMRLIAVTGYGQPGDREQALASGFDLHMKKPVIVDDLVAALDTAHHHEEPGNRCASPT